MFQKKTIVDIPWQEKKALVRVDFNVPLKEGIVVDDTRIQAALPTIRYLIENGAKVILCSHLGRPKGKVALEYSLLPVATRLSDLLGKKVAFSVSCVGPEATDAVAGLSPGDVLLLENTRFHPQERENDPQFAGELASLGDVFVNDAFGSAHRAHASTEGVATFLPGVAGFLLQKELEYFGSVLESPTQPFMAILGGAKISDKIGVIENLLSKADSLIIGGGMANTFLAAKGIDMRDSLVEPEVYDVAKDLLSKASDKIHLPFDFKIADTFSEDAQVRTVLADEIPEGWQALDIGPQSVESFVQALFCAKLIVWNGPMGVFEFPAFASGTIALAKAVASSSAISVVGGGDSVAALKLAGVIDEIDHVSTGGGASLELLEGKVLPGVAVLQDR